MKSQETRKNIKVFIFLVRLYSGVFQLIVFCQNMMLDVVVCNRSLNNMKIDKYL